MQYRHSKSMEILAIYLHGQRQWTYNHLLPVVPFVDWEIPDLEPVYQ